MAQHGDTWNCCNLPFIMRSQLSYSTSFCFHGPVANRNVMNPSMVPIGNQLIQDLLKFHDGLYIINKWSLAFFKIHISFLSLFFLQSSFVSSEIFALSGTTILCQNCRQYLLLHYSCVYHHFNCHSNVSTCLSSSLPSNKKRPRFFFGNALTSQLSPGSCFLFSASRYFAFQPCTVLGKVSVVDLLVFQIGKCRIAEAIPLSVAFFPVSTLSASLNSHNFNLRNFHRNYHFNVIKTICISIITGGNISKNYSKMKPFKYFPIIR